MTDETTSPSAAANPHTPDDKTAAPSAPPVPKVEGVPSQLGTDIEPDDESAPAPTAEPESAPAVEDPSEPAE